MTTDTSLARAAADRLAAALAGHLAAVENRGGEHDPAVQGAFVELRAAAAAYDDALYSEHGEVTPFDLPPLPAPGAAEDEDWDDEDEGEPGRFSLVARWDFTLADRGLLVATASTAAGEDLDSAAVALAALANAYGHSHLGDVETALGAGLRWHGATTWVLGAEDADPDADGDGWMDDAFADADPDTVLCRFDAPVIWRRPE